MLFIFVEGLYDEKLLKRIYKYSLNKIQIIQYSTKSPKQVNNFINSIKNMPKCDYVFFSDSDGNSKYEKKRKLLNKYNKLDKNKIIVVCFEIESWYYAGISYQYCLKQKIEKFTYCTNNITKEIFKNKLPKESYYTDIMLNILDNFSEELACKRNESFNYFYKIKDELFTAV